MTGYGRGAAPFGNRRVVVQMKSVNHRFVDIKLRGMPLDPAVEEKVSQALRKRVQRGSIALTVRIEGAGGAPGAHVDVEAAKRIHRELVTLAEALGGQPVSLDIVVAQPGVMVPRESDDDSDALATAVVEALDQALDSLIEMRDAEGATLAADLRARLDRIGELAGQLGALAEAAPEAARDRLLARIERLLEDTGIQADATRLAQEVALLADRQDVTEELVRIGSHLDQFRKLMAGRDPVGRRLDFLVQELGREVNTVGSKSQSAEIAALVVEAKAELEKIREQVQNVE